MAGTKKGGKKASETNLKKYGSDFYARIGRMGGKNSNTGGFASFKEGSDGLTGWQRAKIAGAKGGSVSKRRKGMFTKSELILVRDYLNKEGMYGKVLYARCYRGDGVDRVTFVSKDKQLDFALVTAHGCKYEEITQQLNDYFAHGTSD